MKSYEKFASLYDELMDDFDYNEWSNYIISIFEYYGIKPNNILEMACGTGNLTYHLAKRRYNLVAFDLSSEMLTKAYEKLHKFNNVKLLNQNMVDFSINKSFDCVVSICDSINYILIEEELLKCFQNVYKHLESDGIFIFDINSHYKLKTIIGNNTFAEDRGNLFYTWQNFFDNDNELCEFYLTFFKRNENGLYHRFDEDHIEKAYKNDFIRKILKDVGFKKVDYYNSFTFDIAHDTSERINFVALK